MTRRSCRRRECKKGCRFWRRRPRLPGPLPEPFPRVYLAARPHPVAGADEALKYVLALNAPLLESPVVEEAAAEIPPARWGEGNRQNRRLFTHPGRAGGRRRPAAVLSGRNVREELDRHGRRPPARVFPANYLFGASKSPPSSRVVFEYRPASFRWGAALALLSLAAVLGIGLRARNKGFRLEA